MSVEENKARVRRWFTETVTGRVEVSTLLRELDETFAPTFVDHDGPDPEHGRDALKKTLPGLLQACPDAKLTIEHLIGEGDYLAMRVRGEATHTGELLGRPPTGRRITWTENEIFRLEGGQIAESWGEGTLHEALATIGLSFREASVPRGNPF